MQQVRSCGLMIRSGAVSHRLLRQPRRSLLADQHRAGMLGGSMGNPSGACYVLSCAQAKSMNNEARQPLAALAFERKGILERTRQFILKRSPQSGSCSV